MKTISYAACLALGEDTFLPFALSSNLSNLSSPRRATSFKALSKLLEASLTDLVLGREFFPDARLQKLIGLALENNRDLRVAMLNVEAARAQYRLQIADLLPAILGCGS